MIVCHCKGTTDREIRRARRRGPKDPLRRAPRVRRRRLLRQLPGDDPRGPARAGPGPADGPHARRPPRRLIGVLPATAPHLPREPRPGPRVVRTESRTKNPNPYPQVHA